ncbi:hypothetical protein DFH06DRAFT_1332489 [Mycena polygramma]|nr:hypothetical protein DFH06DRAFT_1332489 [Mycena polygramma]
MRAPATDDEVSTTDAALRQQVPKFPEFASGFLYATQSSSRRMVAVPYNYGVTKIRSTNDLFINAWIPTSRANAHVVDRSIGRLLVTHFPGTLVPLEFAYTVFFVPPRSSVSSPDNNCGCLRSSNSWSGNVLVIKNGKRKAVINVEKDNALLVDSIVNAVIEGGLLK